MTLVLVVDDDQDLAEMLGIVLTGAGIDVEMVGRGDEALEAFRETNPDLVLNFMKNSCSFVPLQFVVKAKVELSENGNIIPVKND